ncbi:MAG: DUF6428 family protein [Deinococcota bacterium]|jgi:hypothetical protein|nr:DUF6428 family protein [Deinococcota bacterium]
MTRTVPIPAAPTTDTRSFLEAVEGAGKRPLLFMLEGSLLVGPGYHVTEVKALSYHAMDCGGQAQQWRETLVQLWNPAEQEAGEFMSAAKFLSIYRRVARSIPVDEAAELRFEYGNLHRPAIHYHVGSVEAQDDQLLAHLRSPVVTCKARDRRHAQAACCPPALSTAEVSDAVPEPALAAPLHRAGHSCC